MAKKILDLTREVIRRKHYSYQTEKTYTHWIKRFILFHHKRHFSEMEKLEIEQFLTSLAHNNLSPPSQNQAFNTILFLYNNVLKISKEEQNIQALHYYLYREKNLNRYHTQHVLCTNPNN